jgi:signal transduction histidine kinase
MRRASRLHRWLARTDTRAALTMGATLIVAIAVQGALLYAFVAMESLEEADRWMTHALQDVRRELAASLEESAPALVTRDSDGDVLHAWGRWPEAEHAVATLGGEDARHLGSAWLLRSSNHLVGRIELPSGQTRELALPLSHFASETAEVGSWIALLTVCSGLLAVIVAVGATRWAFAPLRKATGLLASVDPRRLGRRLPTRGSGDAVDRHAERLNGLLADVDASFDRLRNFTADVAHELRTPLNRMFNVAEVALLQDDAAGARAALESIHSTARDLSGVVQALLLLAEIDDASFVLRRSEIEVGPWIEGTVETFEPAFEERSVSLVARADPGRLSGDRVLLDRLVANLLENALRHTPPGGRVELSAERLDGDWRICVEDSGAGIPEHARERVFDRFARLDPTVRRTGAGIGLALARAIARRHGGDLVATEAPRSKGARLVLTLPASAASELPPSRGDDESVIARRGERP